MTNTVTIPLDTARALAIDARQALDTPDLPTATRRLLTALTQALPDPGEPTTLEQAQALLRHNTTTRPVANGILDIAQRADDRLNRLTTAINSDNRTIARLNDNLTDERRATTRATNRTASYSTHIDIHNIPPTPDLAADDEAYIVRTTNGRTFPAVRHDVDDGYPWEDLQHEWYDDEQITVLATVRDGSADNDEYDDDWED